VCAAHVAAGDCDLDGTHRWLHCRRVRLRGTFLVPIWHHDHPARVHYCCVTGERNLNPAVYTVSNVADDDANTYIYYTFIILHYTVRISLASPHSTLSARSLCLLSAAFFGGLRIACPCSQSARATTASPAPLPGRVVVGRRSHSSDHHKVDR